MINQWTISSNFMYPKEAVAGLVSLMEQGLLETERFRPQTFSLENYEEAIAEASRAKGLDFVTFSFN